MSKTTDSVFIAEITEDHPVFKAALSAYTGVKTAQVRKNIMDVASFLNGYDKMKLINKKVNEDE